MKRGRSEQRPATSGVQHVSNQVAQCRVVYDGVTFIVYYLLATIVYHLLFIIYGLLFLIFYSVQPGGTMPCSLSYIVLTIIVRAQRACALRALGLFTSGRSMD